MIKSKEAAATLREKLQQGGTHFVFRKKDGSRREAIGTTNLVVIPQDQWPKDMGAEIKAPKNESVVTYYDMEKLSWRSCRTDSILEVEGQEVSDE
jgi:hypothetical protein